MNQRAAHRLIGLLIIGLAYEWVVSGLVKIVSGTFVSGLYDHFHQAIPHLQYAFYGQLLESLGSGVPTVIVGEFVQYGELLIGLSFAVIAVFVWRNRLSKSLLVYGLAVALLSTFLNLNFFFYQGGSVFVNPADPYDEGIPIDLIMAFIEVCIACTLYSVLRGKTRMKMVKTSQSVHVFVPRGGWRNGSNANQMWGECTW